MKYDVYDFDKTIYDGDSGVDIILFAIKKKPSRIFKSLWYCLKYVLKLLTKEEFKSKMFSFVKDIDDMDGFIREFWDKHEHKIKFFWKEKKNHKKDVIISASAYFWLQYIADKYKAPLIATFIDPKTGEVVGKNCHGKEKVRLFYENYPKGVIENAYTDSINDLPLIEEAKEGYLVRKNKIMKYYDYKPNFIIRFWRWGWSIYHKNEELWNYLIVGGLTTLVSLGVKWGLLFTVFDASDAFQLQTSIIISWICAVSFAYITNRIYVFKSKNKKIIKEIMSFFGARVLTLLLEMGIMWFFITLLSMNSDMWVLIWTIVTQILVMVLNYVFSKIFVFKKQK